MAGAPRGSGNFVETIRRVEAVLLGVCPLEQTGKLLSGGHIPQGAFQQYSLYNSVNSVVTSETWSELGRPPSLAIDLYVPWRKCSG